MKTRLVVLQLRVQVMEDRQKAQSLEDILLRLGPITVTGVTRARSSRDTYARTIATPIS